MVVLGLTSRLGKVGCETMKQSHAQHQNQWEAPHPVVKEGANPPSKFKIRFIVSQPTFPTSC